ncbi:MAG: hypothetical protein CO149_05110, partial [Nitrospirae bacterium CG_4_9_14_3_um_filter_51_5]
LISRFLPRDSDEILSSPRFTALPESSLCLHDSSDHPQSGSGDVREVRDVWGGGAMKTSHAATRVHHLGEINRGPFSQKEFVTQSVSLVGS